MMQKPASKDRCAASLVRASAASAALQFKKYWRGCFAGLALSRLAIDAMPTASATAKNDIMCSPTPQPPIFALGLPGPLWTIVVSTAAAERRAAHQDGVVLSACSPELLVQHPHLRPRGSLGNTRGASRRNLVQYTVRAP